MPGAVLKSTWSGELLLALLCTARLLATESSMGSWERKAGQLIGLWPVGKESGPVLLDSEQDN